MLIRQAIVERADTAASVKMIRQHEVAKPSSPFSDRRRRVEIAERNVLSTLLPVTPMAPERGRTEDTSGSAQ